DESESEEVNGRVIDSDDDGQPGQIPGTSVAHERTTRKVWVSHPPAYLPEEVSVNVAIFREAHVYLELDRIQKEKEGKGVLHIPRRCGDPREHSELPSLCGATVNRHRIPRSMVRPEWLLTDKGKEQDN
ncbi:hypothetical protein BD413DRAFT_431984, partial [Trametes elegans]